MILGIGGFFKRLGGFFYGIIPLIKSLLKNPVIRAIIIAKIGDRWLKIIEALIDAADAMEIDNTSKHNYVKNELRTRGLTTYDAPDAELDMYISGVVASRRRPDRIKILTESSTK